MESTLKLLVSMNLCIKNSNWILICSVKTDKPNNYWIFWYNIEGFLNHIHILVEKEYAKIPEVFHYDNFDQCMMLKDDAFFCSLTYELEPIDKEQPSETWRIIKVIADISPGLQVC